MKKLKIITITLIAFFAFTTICSSQILTNPYIGTWQYQNNNEIFEVTLWLDNTLWEDKSVVLGHYRKYTVDNNGFFISEIFNSNKQLGSSNQNWPYVIYAGKYENGDNIIGGPISDNTVTNAPNGRFISGGFSMEIQPPTCNGCSPTAIWNVKKDQDLEENIIEHSIPTDCILTKQ